MNPNCPIERLPAEAMSILRHTHLLRDLVRRQILCEILENIDIPKEAQNQELRKFKEEKKIKDDEEMENYLKLEGLTQSDMVYRLTVRDRMVKYSLDAFGKQAEHSFLAYKVNLDTITYSMIRLENKCLAIELYLRIAEGEAEFSDLAAKYGEGIESNNKGIIGPISLTKAHPALAEVLRTATPGKILEPFRIENWWLVVRLEKLVSTSFDAKTKEMICLNLLEEWLARQTDERMIQISTKFPVGMLKS